MKLLKVRMTKKADTSPRKLMKSCDITPGQILVQWEAIKDMLLKIGVDIKKTRPTAYWEDVLFKKKTTGFPRKYIEKIEKRKTLEEARKSDLIGVAKWTYFLRLFVTISYQEDKDAWYFELIPAAWDYPGTQGVNWNSDVTHSLYDNEWNFSSKDRIRKIIPFKEVRKFINGEFKNLFKKMQGADLKKVFNPVCVGIGEKYKYAFKNFKTGKIEFTNNENYYE